MSIKQLPEDVAAQIKSSVVIVSLNSVVYGLSKNSLDAGASKLNVSVDYRRGNCTVEDDGQGIPPSDFQKDGLGKLYYTSKYPPCPSRHGRHGTFLASVAAMSLLTITSHHTEYNSHNSLTIHNSNLVARNTPALPDQRVLTFPHGTRVTVRDLFGTMPVRVKQRALEIERSRSTKDFDQLVLSLVALVIAWPGEVSVSLRDANSHQMLTLRTTEPGRQRVGQSSPDVPRILSRTPRLLAQASLYDGSGIDSWVPIGASTPAVSITGCVCVVPVATKRLQFLAIGIEPFMNEYRSNFLYEEINRVFANSAFGVVDGADDSDAVGPSEEDGVPKSRDLKTRKGIDRWPMFCLQISLHDESFSSQSDLEDLFDGRSQGLTMITDLLRTISFEFLKRHHFRPKSGRSTPGVELSDSETTASPSDQTLAAQSQSVSNLRGSGTRNSQPPLIAKDRPRSSRRGESSRRNEAIRRPRSRPESPFDFWCKVKAGRSLAAMPKLAGSTDPAPSEPVRRETTHDKLGIPHRTDRTPSPATLLSLIDSSGQLLRKPFDDIRRDDRSESVPTNRSQPDARTQLPQSSNQQNETLVWEDPMTKIRPIIDAKTGPVVNTNTRTNTRNLAASRSHLKTEGTPRPSPWIEDILSTWENPAFYPTEPPIPRISGVSEEIVPRADNGNPCSATTSLMFGDSVEATSMRLLSRISRNALREAEIIGQVDMKFILTKVPLDTLNHANGSPGLECDQKSLLVLIDQHAADERCRVESLMKSYFSSDESGSWTWDVRTEALEKPLVFELSNQDGHLLRLHKTHLERWGVIFKIALTNDADSERGKKENVKVEVQSLPPSISERCRLEPKLLVDLLRKEIWKLHDEPGPMANAKDNRHEEPGELDWVRMFHGCPQGILDLINSRSCRSAIMFNDPLTMEQCNDLVKRLTDCAFPFQCAHGRPSMVPLVDLGTKSTLGPADTEVGDGMTLLKELKVWKDERTGLDGRE